MARSAQVSETVQMASTATVDQPPTSYTAKGAIEKPPPDQLTEVGIADTVGALVEYVPELVGRTNQIRAWRKMQWNDAQVKAMLTLLRTPILGGKYYVEPAGPDPIDQDCAEFVAYNLFQNMTISWPRLLFEVTNMFGYGSAVFEHVLMWDEWAPFKTMSNRKKYIMLRKIAPRPAWTIKSFQYDANGGPAGIIQRVKDPSKPQSQFVEKPIAIEKLLIFTNEQDGGNLEGTSALRSAYKHWYYKDNFYKIDAVQKERHGIGVPRVKTPPGVTQAQKRTAKMLGRQLRTNEEGQIVQPWGWEIDFVKVEGQLTNALESASHHDLMIMRSILGQFINSGAGADSGGRATAGAHVDMFLKAQRGVAEYICEIFNLYLIADLARWNFPVVRYPKLKVRRIGDRRDYQMWTAALKNAYDAGVFSPTWETENEVRDELDMSKISQQDFDKQQKAKAAQNQPPPQGQPGQQPGQPGQPGTPSQNKPGAPGGTGNTGKPPNAAQ